MDDEALQIPTVNRFPFQRTVLSGDILFMLF